MIDNDWENNIMICRGKSAQQIYDITKDNFSQLLDRGVKKYVISIGTVDLLNMPDSNISPEDSASNVISALNSFLGHLSSHSQIIYIMPAPNSLISSGSYNAFTSHIGDFLDENNIKSISACHEMAETTYEIHNKNLCEEIRNGRFDELVTLCTTDGIHWIHELVRNVIRSALDLFSIRCSITKNRLSCFRLAVQKQVHGCYICGSSTHTIGSCTVSNPRCSVCRKRDHTTSACGYKYLPCKGCGQIGHNAGEFTQCPSRPSHNSRRHNNPSSSPR
jgi:hypothetical protein